MLPSITNCFLKKTERMIAISTGRKRSHVKALATTPSREFAYYIDPALMRDTGMLGEVKIEKTAESPSGDEWFPSILDNGRLTAFIPGNPGAGKSYLAKELINLLPSDYDVLLFTALEEEDGNFADLKQKLHKIRMEPENLKRLTLSTIRKVSRHPVLLFDDIDKIRDKEVEKLTFAILEDALANGRGHKAHDGEGDIHVIVTTHSLNDYRKTKYTLENSDYVAVFPASTTYVQLRRLFEKMGLDKDLCDRVVEAGKGCMIRRAIIHKVSPMYIIIGGTIELL